MSKPRTPEQREAKRIYNRQWWANRTPEQRAVRYANTRKWLAVPENRKDRNRQELACYHRNKQQYKINAFLHYGGLRCVWCRDNDVNCLTLDHVHNHGKAHRKEAHNNMYRWLAARGYPNDPPLQTLCNNCQLAKEINGGVLPPSRKDKYAQFPDVA